MEPLTFYIHHFNPLLAIGIFIATYLVDCLYVYYTLAMVKKEPARAAALSATINLCYAFGIVNCAGNPLYLFVIVVASWFSTYFTVKKSASDEPKT